MTFQIGQKVECVVPHYNAPRGIGAVKGKTYTVRDLGETFSGECGIRVLEFELTCGPFEYGIKGGQFRDAFMMASRFRPIVERKTSIEIFTRMLTPKKQGVRA